MSVVGVDLGTTNTVVGCVRAGKVHILADEGGRRLLPSVVSFHPNGDVLVGEAAKARRMMDAANTIYSHKRLIGRSWGSPEIAQARSRFAFELREGPGQGPLVVARGQDYTLPEISAFVLRRTRQIAERALGGTVERAVITVPAHFNELQRAATKVAGRVAGLEVLRILNEPTAAALAYGLGRSGSERVAVYDFGGGTFDCTLLDLNGNVFEVLATAGDSFLGGDDVDSLIADRMAETFLRLHRQDARQDIQMFERLKASAEQVKIALSAAESFTLVLENFGHGAKGKMIDFPFTLTRGELEAMVTPLIDRTFQVTQDALALARLSPTSFDKVILVGGSTRIPLVRKRVEAFFGAPPMDRVNPDEVVAIGAAIQAAALTEGLRRRSIPPPPTSARAAAPAEVDDSTLNDASPVVRPADSSSPTLGGRSPIPKAPASSQPTLDTRKSPAAKVPPARPRLPTIAGVAPPSVPDATEVDEQTEVRRGSTTARMPSIPSFEPPPSTPRMHGRPPPAIKKAPPTSERRSAPPPLPSAPPPPPPALTPVAPVALRGPRDTAPSFSNEGPPPFGQTAPLAPFAQTAPLAPFGQTAPLAPFAQTAPFGSPALPVEPLVAPRLPASEPPRAQQPLSLAPAFSMPSAPPVSPFSQRPPVLVDVTPRALVVETAGGFTDTVITRNAKIPCERTRRFATSRDMQTSVRVRVAQGEDPAFGNNTYLGEVELTGLRAGPRGTVTLAVTFEVDANGTLRVRARDDQTGHEARATLQLVGIANESSVVAMMDRMAQAPVTAGPPRS